MTENDTSDGYKPLTSKDIERMQQAETERRERKKAKGGSWNDQEFTVVERRRNPKKDPQSVGRPTGLPTGWRSSGRSSEGFGKNPEDIVAEKED